MREYPLRDAHGQPLALFKANYENNVSKAIDQLSGICTGILADGVVSEQEASFFAQWVRKHAPYEPVWPFTDILARIERIFADGICDAEEREELKQIMEAICGRTETTVPDEDDLSSSLPLSNPPPSPIAFAGGQFVITGRFAHGTRAKVVETIESLGGSCNSSKPTRSTNYLVIGTFASRDWYNTNYGRKIERAVELRDQGSGISIISEEWWNQHL